MPLWLAPTQVVVASVISDANNYVDTIVEMLLQNNIRAVADKRNEKISYKIREHSLTKTPIILVVGAREVEGGTVVTRRLGSKETETLFLKSFLQEIKLESLPPDCKTS